MEDKTPDAQQFNKKKIFFIIVAGSLSARFVKKEIIKKMNSRYDSPRDTRTHIQKEHNMVYFQHRIHTKIEQMVDSCFLGN